MNAISWDKGSLKSLAIVKVFFASGYFFLWITEIVGKGGSYFTLESGPLGDFLVTWLLTSLWPLCNQTESTFGQLCNHLPLWNLWKNLPGRWPLFTASVFKSIKSLLLARIESDEKTGIVQTITLWHNRIARSKTAPLCITWFGGKFKFVNVAFNCNLILHICSSNWGFKNFQAGANHSLEKKDLTL